MKRVGVITSPRLGIGHARSPIHNAALRQQPQQIVSQYLHTEMGLDDSTASVGEIAALSGELGTDEVVRNL